MLSLLCNHAEHPKKLAPYYMLSPFYNSKISIPNQSVSLFGEDDFSLRKKLSYMKKSGLQDPTGPSSYRSDHNDQDHEDSLRSNEPPIRPSKTPSARLLRLHLLKLILLNIYKRIWIRSFNQSSKLKLKYQKEDYLGTNSKPGLLTSTAVDLTSCIITSVNSVKTTLPLLKLPGLTKF